MTDYEQLVKALRDCASGDGERCLKCTYHKASNMPCDNALMTDAAAAIEELQDEVQELKRVNLEIFEDLPKRGEWVPYEFNTNGTWHKCSVCGVAYQYKDAPNSGWWINHKYCPNCGAKMEVQE